MEIDLRKSTLKKKRMHFVELNGWLLHHNDKFFYNLIFENWRNWEKRIVEKKIQTPNFILQYFRKINEITMESNANKPWHRHYFLIIQSIKISDARWHFLALKKRQWKSNDSLSLLILYSKFLVIHLSSQRNTAYYG